MRAAFWIYAGNPYAKGRFAPKSSTLRKVSLLGEIVVAATLAAAAPYLLVGGAVLLGIRQVVCTQ
jgi:hypothetical protein